MKRTPLARNTAFKPRKTGLPAKSKARAQQQAAQRRAYGEAPGSEWCEVCGAAGPVEHSHLLTQGGHKLYRNNPLNWLLKCRGCHELYEHNKREFARQWPDAWALILARIEEFAPIAFLLFRHKNPY